MSSYDLRVIAARDDWDQLPLMDERDLHDSVLSFAGSYEDEPPPNFDQLMYAGICLSVRDRVDATLIGWLEASLTALRVDIACAILNGYWLSDGKGNRRVDAPTLARLVAAKARAARSANADYSFALVLDQVLTGETASDEALRIAVSAMASSLDLGTGHDGLDLKLREWGTVSLAKARARLGER
jgi:hypothetical protein